MGVFRRPIREYTSVGSRERSWSKAGSPSRSMQPLPCPDTIHINELLLTLSISDNDFEDKEANLQAILLSLAIPHDISRTARSDDLAYSINYAAVYKTLAETLPKTRHTSLEALADHAFGCLFRSHPEVGEVSVVVTARDTLPRCTVATTRSRSNQALIGTRFTVDGLGFPAIIGVNPRERTEKQPVVFDITVHRQQRTTSQKPFQFLGLSTSIHQVWQMYP